MGDRFDLDGHPCLERFNGRMDDLAGAISILPGSINLIRAAPCVHLIDKGGDPVRKRIKKFTESSKNRVGLDFLDQITGRIERRLPPHILKN